MKQILWPESGKSFSQEFNAYIHRIRVHSSWGKAISNVAIPVFFISGLGGLLFGWVFLKLTTSEVIREIKSNSWPRVEAIVKSSYFELADVRSAHPDNESEDWYHVLGSMYPDYGATGNAQKVVVVDPNVTFEHAGVFAMEVKGTANWYQVRVGYEYTVGGAIYTSSEGVGGSFTEKGVNKLFSKYRSGTPVAVYYNPEKPQVATLRRGIRPGKILPMFLFTFMLLGTGSFLLMLWFSLVGAL
ncbi:MAG: DUF3592 domain-containing protein [Chloroflexi bacterium]|nr:DUF3592 domain-containing protein [Chloroflexota bacterium]